MKHVRWNNLVASVDDERLKEVTSTFVGFKPLERKKAYASIKNAIKVSAQNVDKLSNDEREQFASDIILAAVAESVMFAKEIEYVELKGVN